jgi:hypothetical protein
MGEFTVNMNDFTEKLFCDPADAETLKTILTFSPALWAAEPVHRSRSIDECSTMSPDRKTHTGQTGPNPV